MSKLPPSAELLSCVDATVGDLARCGECGRVVFGATAVGPFVGTVDIEVACPRCPARVIVRLTAA
jgi:DNA-directed RNA polymerase subunit RPC12/RpoP